ncbi:MAG: M23 family metallopeptidase [Lysobacter sp.]
MRALLVFIAGVLVGANAVYFLMTWKHADPDAVVVFDRIQQAPPADVSDGGDKLPAAAAPELEPAPRRTDASPSVPAVPDARLRLPAATHQGRLIVPVRGVAAADLSNTFEDARGQARVHEAIDIMAARDTPVLAVADGTVEKLFTSEPGGLTIYQFEPSGRYAYYYAHLDRYAANLAEGQALKQGDVIGYVGSTGNANDDAPHLHFGIFLLGPEKHWWEGTAINPYPVLTGRAVL